MRFLILLALLIAGCLMDAEPAPPQDPPPEDTCQAPACYPDIQPPRPL